MFSYISDFITKKIRVINNSTQNNDVFADFMNFNTPEKMEKIEIALGEVLDGEQDEYIDEDEIAKIAANIISTEVEIKVGPKFRKESISTEVFFVSICEYNSHYIALFDNDFSNAEERLKKFKEDLENRLKKNNKNSRIK